MAGNDAITRIIWDASGTKQGADVTQATGAQIIATNRAVTDSMAKTAAAAKAAGSAVGEAAKKAAADVDGAADLVAKSTDRVVVSLTRQNQTINAAARQLDPFGSALTKASTTLDKLSNIAGGGGPGRAAALLLEPQSPFPMECHRLGLL